jgi:hypothetical protein
MAGMLLNVNSGEVALVANTPKTILQIKAAANRKMLVNSVQIMGKQPAGGTDTPVKIRITRSTTDFGVGGQVTPGKVDPGGVPDAEAPESMAYANFVTEPDSPIDSGLWYEFQPQTGLVIYLPPGQEWSVPGSHSLQIEATSTGSPTLVAVLGCAEGGTYFDTTSGEVAVNSATGIVGGSADGAPHTLLMIKAASTRRVLMHELHITGKAAANTTATPTPVKFRLARIASVSGATTSATGTTGNPIARNPSDGETLQTTTLQKLTVEPAPLVPTGLWWEVSPLADKTVRFDPPVPIPAGASLQVEATGNGSEQPTMIATAICEE